MPKGRHFLHKIRLRVTSGGFSLLEVLAAVAILAVAVLSLYSLQNQSIDLSNYVNEMTIATMLAKDRLTELEMKVRYPNFAIQKKAFTDDFPGFLLEDITEGDAGVMLQLPQGMAPKVVGVKVTWKRKGKDESMSLRSFAPP